MTSPEWSILSEKYLMPYIDGYTKDYNEYFGIDAKKNIHNTAFNMLQNNAYIQKRKKINLRRQGMVIHSDKMLPFIQKKLLEQHKVVKYTIDGKEVYRNNVPWTADEEATLKTLRGKGESYKVIARTLRRSRRSVADKGLKLGL
ncbi:MAG: hypothetical protein ACYCS1_04275 [Gammaproteobacteria bacterium]